MVERFEAESDDIRGTLAEAVAAAEAPAPDPVEAIEPSTETAASPAKPAKPEVSKPVAPTPKPGKPPEPVSKPSEKPKSEVTGDKPQETVVPAKSAELKAPDNWSAEHKAIFEKQTDESKKFLLERHSAMEADHTRKTTDLANQRRDYETIDKIFAPHEAKMREQGFTKSSMVQAWANVEMDLMNPQKREAVMSRIIGAYNIDRGRLAQLLGVNPAQGQSSVAQPQAQPQQPAPWEPELGAIKDRLNAWDAQVREARAIELNSHITNFRNEMDEKGAPLHPHFDDLEQDMVKLVAAAQARGEPVPPVSQLYETAVWANPSTRQKLLEVQNAATEAQTLAAQQDAAKKEREQARVQAEKARRAAKSVTGAPGSGNAPTRRQPARSLRDELAAQVEDAENSAAA